MKITTSLSPQAIDFLTGAMSLPAVALIAVGCALLFALALFGGLGLRLLRVPARTVIHSLSRASRVAIASSHH